MGRTLRKYKTENGVDLYLVNISYHDNGEMASEVELKQRIAKLALNIKKCGSYEKLIEMGGEATKKYLKNTRHLLREYLFDKQTECLIVCLDDLRDAVIAVNTSKEIHGLVAQASWEDIEKYATALRNSLMDVWFDRSVELVKTKQQTVA